MIEPHRLAIFIFLLIFFSLVADPRTGTKHHLHPRFALQRTLGDTHSLSGFLGLSSIFFF
jgi:hypothetical protein